MSELHLLHQDADLVAIDKPSGLLVHPSGLDAHETVTALDLLQAQLGQRLWPLHRLDKGTSGVLLFARSGNASKRGIRPANCVGVVDADYRGPVMVPLVSDHPLEDGMLVKAGDRIAQAMVVGDRHPYIVGLIVPDTEWAIEWAQANGEKFDMKALQDLPAFRSAVRAALDRFRRGAPFYGWQPQVTPTLAAPSSRSSISRYSVGGCVDCPALGSLISVGGIIGATTMKMTSSTSITSM